MHVLGQILRMIFALAAQSIWQLLVKADAANRDSVGVWLGFFRAGLFGRKL